MSLNTLIILERRSGSSSGTSWAYTSLGRTPSSLGFSFSISSIAFFTRVAFAEVSGALLIVSKYAHSGRKNPIFSTEISLMVFSLLPPFRDSYSERISSLCCLKRTSAYLKKTKPKIGWPNLLAARCAPCLKRSALCHRLSLSCLSCMSVIIGVLFAIGKVNNYE